MKTCVALEFITMVAETENDNQARQEGMDYYMRLIVKDLRIKGASGWLFPDYSLAFLTDDNCLCSYDSLQDMVDVGDLSPQERVHIQEPRWDAKYA